MTTGLVCGLALFFAFALFVRERRLWRARAEVDGILFRYSRRRYLRRAAGCVVLAVDLILVFLGLEVLDFTGHLTFLQVYWALVGFATISLLVLPVLDLRETYKNFAGSDADERLRQELAGFEAQLRARAQDGSRRPQDRGGRS